MVRAQQTAAARVRLFNDLSAKPDVCNPMTAGSPCREPSGEPTEAGADRLRATVSDS
jgi:hypothetical protein